MDNVLGYIRGGEDFVNIEDISLEGPGRGQGWDRPSLDVAEGKEERVDVQGAGGIGGAAYVTNDAIFVHEDSTALLNHFEQNFVKTVFRGEVPVFVRHDGKRDTQAFCQRSRFGGGAGTEDEGGGTVAPKSCLARRQPAHVRTARQSMKGPHEIKHDVAVFPLLI